MSGLFLNIFLSKWTIIGINCIDWCLLAVVCAEIMCAIYCEFGYQQTQDGCDTCSCLEDRSKFIYSISITSLLCSNCYNHKQHCILNVRNTSGYRQRPVYSHLVYPNICIQKDLWKFELNWSLKLQEACNNVWFQGPKKGFRPEVFYYWSEMFYTTVLHC